MSVGNFYLSEISLRQKKNDDIIIEVLKEEGFSNIQGITGDDVEGICGKLSGNTEDNCRDQLDGTRDSGKSDSVTLKYWKAVSKGYEGTIDDFEKRQNLLSNVLSYGLDTANVLTGLVKPKGGTSQGRIVESDSKGFSTGAKVGVAIGVVALVGGLVYFMTKK